MPEQNTPAPIKVSDIRKGDRIRIIQEVTASGAYGESAPKGVTYELLNRPVVLPTEPGYYLDRLGCMWQVHNDGELSRLGNNDWRPEECLPFALLRPVPEVVAEVLKDLLADMSSTWNPLPESARVIAAKYGVTL